MRILGFCAFCAFAFVAGCGKSPAPTASAPPVASAPIANSVSGTIMLREPRELSDDAKIEIRVVDVAQPTTPLAQSVIPNANHPPISFNLPIDPHAVDPKRTYSVNAILTDGARRYLPVLQYPVLTNKAPSANIQVIVAPEPTPGEKLFDAYNKAFAQIGTMRQFSGTSTDDNSSTAWDAFASNGKVKFVREITDLDNDKGRVSIKMAYQNDKPWVVVKEESTGGNARPFATTRVGWDDDGQLVLKDKLANGHTTEASDEEAKALSDHATRAFNMTSQRVPKQH
ncbi:MAG: YbaY family lipoprotein [Rudaea sp.]